ncbi:MAG: zf-HC2 domain-containing protein [Planctomycetia bacterium]|nr:zf-HC2 domain-containing protein [Planctomycetia bacterium]
MNCEAAENLIAALLAGELPDADCAALDAHLATCEACRELQAEWSRDDEQLRAGFTAWRAASETVAARTIRQLHREQLRTSPAATNSRVWPAFLGGLAAGFLLALLVWRPWAETPAVQQTVNLGPVPAPDAPSNAPPPTVAAKTVLASVVGNVEVLADQQGAWTAAVAGQEVPLGASIRTASDGLCEFTCPDGNTARMNVDTQVDVRQGSELELVRGQVWAGTQPGDEICVKTTDGAVLAQGGAVDVRRADSEMFVTAASGDAIVQLLNRTEPLRAGEELVIANSQVSRRDRAYSLALITAWMNPLLALKSPDDPELSAQVDALLSHLGETKMNLLSDAELRSLGPSCTVPLSRYVRSEDSQQQQERRRHAARLLADLAPVSLIGDMIELLADDDPEIRVQAATALRRLTGLEMDCPIEHWRESADDLQRQALQGWQAWWLQNSFRCQPSPAAPEPAVYKVRT